MQRLYYYLYDYRLTTMTFGIQNEGGSLYLNLNLCA